METPKTAGGFMGRMPVEPRGAVAAKPETVRFEDFFRAHYARLAQAALLLIGDRAEAEDVAQETMARVYERWDRVRTMESPEGYVYRTALNLHRKRARWAAVRSRAALPERSSSPDATDDVAAGVDVLRGLATLPRSQREAVVVVSWLGYTAEEAGRALGLAPSSVRVRLHRARMALRRHLGGPDE